MAPDRGDEAVVSTSAAPISLMEVRPALAAFALSPFMEKGIYPELVFRTFFELWHTEACRVRKTSSWEDVDALVDNIVGEEKVPMVSKSEATTAALFCIEALGVSPPPDSGWVPRENTQNSGAGGSAEEVKADWFRNVERPEWIYHSSEDMYYHLPTSSLWERRVVECREPDVEGHTYFRVDAVHLQALSHFATSLDTGLLPLAFKAWLRYMRKKKDRHFGLPAPPASPGKGGVKGQSKSSGSKERAANPSGEPLAGTKEGVSGQAEGTGGADSREAGAAAADAAQAPPLSELAGTAKAPDVRPDDPEAGVGATQDPKPGAEDQPLASKGENNRKGLFCLRCFRSSRKNARSESNGPAETTPDAAAQSLTAAATASSAAKSKQNGPAGAIETKSDSLAASARMTDSARSSLEAKHPSIETVDRHMRKLESFLELVKKNPQRLVDHVERRRQTKTTLGFMVM